MCVYVNINVEKHIAESLTAFIINCGKQCMRLLDCKAFLMKSSLIHNATFVVNFCMILSENELFPLGVDKQG